MSYMDVLWIKIATSYPKWPLLARTQSLSHCGHPSIKLRNTSTGKPAAAFRRDRFKHSILGYVYLQAISWSFGPQFLHQGGLGLGLQKANLKWRWSPEYFTPSTAGLSVPCVLELSPAENCPWKRVLQEEISQYWKFKAVSLEGSCRFSSWCIA